MYVSNCISNKNIYEIGYRKEKKDETLNMKLPLHTL